MRICCTCMCRLFCDQSLGICRYPTEATIAAAYRHKLSAQAGADYGCESSAELAISRDMA